MRINTAFQSVLLLSLLTSCSPRSNTPIAAPAEVQETSGLVEPGSGVDGTVSVQADNTVELNGTARVNLTSAPVGSSLETANYPSVEFMVSELSEAIKETGLTLDRIEALVESQLDEALLVPLPVSLDSAEPFLSIVIDGRDSAFDIVIEFRREVFYLLPNEGSISYSVKRIFPIVWSTRGSGTHDQNADLILLRLEGVLSQFLIEYRRANGR